jgi:hypothetical protein
MYKTTKQIESFGRWILFLHNNTDINSPDSDDDYDDDDLKIAFNQYISSYIVDGEIDLYFYHDDNFYCGVL